MIATRSPASTSSSISPFAALKDDSANSSHVTVRSPKRKNGAAGCAFLRSATRSTIGGRDTSGQDRWLNRDAVVDEERADHVAARAAAVALFELVDPLDVVSARLPAQLELARLHDLQAFGDHFVGRSLDQLTELVEQIEPRIGRFELRRAHPCLHGLERGQIAH